MENLVDIIITSNFDNLEENLNKIPFNEQIGLCVIYNDIKYEFLIHMKSDTDNLLCLGPSGLRNMDEINRFKNSPFFPRHSWKFEDSTIFYNDNTRYVWDGGIGSGWGIGTINDYFLENMKDILLKITKFFNIKNENILFYGSSMGGFTSIQLAAMIKNSYALAENPQIDCTKWMKRVYLKQNYYSKLYDDETLSQIEPYRLNVIEMIKKEDYIPNLTIIACRSSEDITYHIIPFIKELENLPFKPTDLNKINILFEPSKIHHPIPQNELHKLIKRVRINNNQDYKKIKYHNEIQKAIPLLKKSRFFDKKYYLHENPEIGNLDPLTHYLIKGWREGKNPSKYFDNDYYLQTYVDVADEGMNPLVHYMLYGIDENRKIKNVSDIENNRPSSDSNKLKKIIKKLKK